MIDAALVELEPNLSLKRACALLGRPRATHYRSLQPPNDTVRRPRASPLNAPSPQLSGSRSRRCYTPRSTATWLNRPGVSGDSIPWKGWGHVIEYVEEVSDRAA